MSKSDGNDGRVVLVAGGGQGIGLAVAQMFRSEGDRVLIVERSGEKLEAAREKLGGDVETAAADVGEPAEVERLADEVEERFGRLDALINCVGNFVFGSTLGHSWEQWRDVVDSNLSSVFLMCRAFAPLLAHSEAGRIVNFAASYASLPSAFPNWGPYAAAKAGVLSLTRTLAVELAAQGTTVNAVSPGLIDTGTYSPDAVERLSRAVPAGRFGCPEEIARAVLFLAAPESAYITGAEIIVGGGWLG